MAVEKNKPFAGSRLVAGVRVKAGDTVQVRQVRSFIGRDEPFRDTLRALGLGRIGKSRELKITSATYGMIRRVEAVIAVE